MLYGPGYSSDEEGFSDDNDYFEYKERLKNLRKQKLQADTEADERDRGLKLVFSAISLGNEAVLLEELDNGFDVNTTLDYEWTPLLLAASKAHKNIISLLIDRGAQLDACRASLTVLMLVCDTYSKDETVKDNILASVKLLLDHKVDVNSTDSKRKTAIMYAAYNNHLETVKFLLPLVDRDAEDNQGWNALFWAVEGNSLETAQFLLEDGFSYDKTDIRGLTISDIALSHGYEDILSLLPKDPIDEFLIYFNNNRFNFEEIHSQIGGGNKPVLFHDVCNILYGTRSESTMSILLHNNIGLFECLSFNDSKLTKIGVAFPFQRRRILQGLYKFHKYPFHPQSVPFVRKNALYTNLDVSSEVLTCLKQLIAMEAGLLFVLEHFDAQQNLAESKEMRILVAQNGQQIKRLKAISLQLVKKSEEWDGTLKPADKITKKRMNIPWANVSVGVVLVSMIVLSRLFKNTFIVYK